MNQSALRHDYSSEPAGEPQIERSSREIYDELLATRCRRRDVAAWDELVDRWNDRLMYYLRRLIDNEHDATNALQDVWLQAFRGLRSLRDSSRLAPWLYTIARRTAMNHFRSKFARRETLTAEVIENETIEVPDEHLNLENAELVHFGLNRLGLHEREVLTLCFLDDLTINEIAALLEIPAGTVKSRLFKARRDLRRILEAEDHRRDK
jgi:RNA polymerase sigma-70 factor (ECF subfamily)